jgi:predicted transcriptional regulator
MDKVFSTRLDADLIRKINILAAKKSVSKKTLIEQALRIIINRSDENLDHEIIDRSFAAWKRDETQDQTVSKVKKAFREGFTRHTKHRALSHA